MDFLTLHDLNPQRMIFGADDGLWLTHPDLADGLAAQRIEHAASLGATTLVTDSPLAAALLAKHTQGHDINVYLLAELIE